MPPLHLATFECEVTPPDDHPLCGGWITPVRGVDDPLKALGVVILGGHRDGKAALLVTVTKDVTQKVSADSVIKAVQSVFEAKGGGRPESASAGGGTPTRLGDAVAAARTAVRERLDGGG